ncbi:hypothetical protein BKA63DRAFT_9157 [Paraphoma chrysanthemicola]|nr:hypothetical protein BKA63DRAFT_9157 [Paraphoma chrysanthemicola]
MARLLIAFGLLPTFVTAYVQVNYPLNQQFPPVATIDTRFVFQFAPTTFRTDSDKIQYSLAGGPPWLSIDSKSRTLSGTPHANDVGEATFTIAASGAAGAVANMDSKLLVVKDSDATPNVNVTQVLSKAGLLSGPRTLSIGPSKPFEITFPLDAFQGTGKSTYFNAILSDHTPLPAWISFDATTLHFAGTTPPTTSTQSYEIMLAACDDPGYVASSISFTIAVSNHQLLFQPFSDTVNVSKGADIHLTDIKSKLLLDGSPTQDRDIRKVNSTLPSWLAFDNTTFEITGQAPSGIMSQDLTISVQDQYGDVAQYSIHIAVLSELFAHEIGQLNASVGHDFDYSIPREILIKDRDKVKMNFGSLSKHLHFDQESFAISGAVPTGFPPGFVQCSMEATSEDGNLNDTQSFQIAVSGPTHNGPTGTAASVKEGRVSSGKMAGIILGSIIGAIAGIVLLVALVLCLHRQRKHNSYLSPKLPRSPRKSDISRPMFIPYGWPDIDIDHDNDQDLEKGKEKYDITTPPRPARRTADHPPKLDVDLPADHRDIHSLTDSIGDVDTRILDDFEESSFGIQRDTAPSQHPPDSMRIPTELAKRASLKSDSFRRHKRRTTTVYQDQIHRSSGLPINRRITGMGHGRHTYSPSRSNTNFSRSSLRRPLSTSSYTTTRCTSMFSTPPSPFPQPTMGRQRTAHVTTPLEERRSIRVVPASRRSSLVDRRTVDEKRNSYFRKRASAQSPFFSALGSRVSSSTYKAPPAFIHEAVQSSPIGPLSPKGRNTIVRPNEDVIEGKEKEVPLGPKTRHASASPSSDKSTRDFPGSLRQNRIVRPHTAITTSPSRVEKSYARPGTSVGPSVRGMGRRASTRDSLRAHELKSRLNDLTGSEIFKDAELSDSVYTDEEEDIEEAEKRATIKPNQFTLPPLNVDTRRRSKRNSGEKQKRTSKRDSQRELKRTSERRLRTSNHTHEQLLILEHRRSYPILPSGCSE